MGVKLSFIIVTWNSEEFISQLLTGLPQGEDYETIVVDNGSQDQTVKIIEKNFPAVKLIKNTQNQFLSRATNQAFNISKGEYLLLLNPDVIIKREAIETMLDFIDKHSEVGALGPKLFNPDGTLQPSCREFPTLGNILWEFSIIPRIFKSLSRWKMGYFDHNHTREVDQPIGSCLMVRRDAFIKAGMMDESLPLFCNDVSLCYNIKKAGYKIYFLAEAAGLHHHGASVKKVMVKTIIEAHHSLYCYLRRSYNKNFLLYLIGTLIFISAVLRIICYRLSKTIISPIKK
ncbi:MAG: glycosyltransferase family 2 protein [candidate division WOR-3 bacterium]